MRLLLITVLLFISGIAFAQDGDTLFYHKQSQLTWNDFKVIPNLASDSLKAHLSVNIGMRIVKTNIWMGYGTYEAHAFTSRESSWVKDDAKKDSTMLRHQQYAFELAEVVARQLETEINKAKINLRWMNKIKKILYNYAQFAAQCHHNYESETQYGLNTAKQTEWETMIDRNELKLVIENSRK